MRALQFSLAILITSAGLARAADEQQSKRELLDKKLAESDRLQREIDVLRAETKTPQQIVVNVRMIEVSLTKLRRLGAAFDVFDGQAHHFEAAEFFSSPAVQTLGDTPALLGLLDALAANNVAKVLADPTLVVVSGRPASFRVGGEVPQPPVGSSPQINTTFYGAEIKVLATTLGDGKVRLDVQPRIAELDESHSIVSNGQKVFATKVREMDTSCEVHFGESIVLCGQSSERVESCLRDGKLVEDVNEIRTLVVVTPQLVEKPGAPRATSDASTKPAAGSAII